MQLDFFLACVAITIGAMVAYAADEQFGLTPRLTAWLLRVFGDS
ncbi:MAG: hypothetical protein SGI92_01385 [Bryobacteraceae bacterium]|nr:hypothetical protein [Bryobacteraceae bacterium]